MPVVWLCDAAAQRLDPFHALDASGNAGKNERWQRQGRLARTPACDRQGVASLSPRLHKLLLLRLLLQLLCLYNTWRHKDRRRDSKAAPRGLALAWRRRTAP